MVLRNPKKNKKIYGHLISILCNGTPKDNYPITKSWFGDHEVLSSIQTFYGIHTLHRNSQNCSLIKKNYG